MVRNTVSVVMLLLAGLASLVMPNALAQQGKAQKTFVEAFDLLKANHWDIWNYVTKGGTLWNKTLVRPAATPELAYA